MSRCTVAGCDREAVAHGLCGRHYGRLRDGRPIEDARSVGSPSGHGRWGLLDHDGDDRVMCHECGGWFRSLASHIWQAHGMSAADYRSAHGLARGTALVCRSMSAARSRQAAARVGTEAWRRLEAARDPAAARAAIDADARAAVAAATRRAPTRRRGSSTDTPAARQTLTWIEEIDAGVITEVEIAAREGTSRQNVAGRVRRLRALLGRPETEAAVRRRRDYHAELSARAAAARSAERYRRWRQAIEAGETKADVARREGVTPAMIRSGLRRLAEWEAAGYA